MTIVASVGLAGHLDFDMLIHRLSLVHASGAEDPEGRSRRRRACEGRSEGALGRRLADDEHSLLYRHAAWVKTI